MQTQICGGGLCRKKILNIILLYIICTHNIVVGGELRKE